MNPVISIFTETLYVGGVLVKHFTEMTLGLISDLLFREDK